ncbi:MAG: hypothetical protein O9326_08325 [Microcystis sp. LE19-338.1B]|nr:hypothetical protein [Microcystis sp. LE19-338.1B]
MVQFPLSPSPHLPISPSPPVPISPLPTPHFPLPTSHTLHPTPHTLHPTEKAPALDRPDRWSGIWVRVVKDTDYSPLQTKNYDEYQ